jgi:hypothetical protein
MIRSTIPPARHAELSLSTTGDNDFCSFAQKAFGSGKAKTGRTASDKSYFSV